MANIQNKSHSVYGVIGIIALVLIGGMMGYIINGSGHLKNATMTEQQCNVVSSKLTEAVKNGNTELIKELNIIYSENCVDREFLQTAQEEKQESACEIFEAIKQKEIIKNKDHYQYGSAETHLRNARIYANLFEKGCKENSNKYKNLALRELEVVKSLQESFREQEAMDIVGVYKTLKMYDEGIKEIDNIDLYIGWLDEETVEEYNIRLNDVKKEMKEFIKQ